MEYKCLKNDIKLYHFPEFNKKLVLYLNHPYYIIIFLLIEFHLSDFEIEYNFQNYFTVIHESSDEVEEIVNMINVVLSTLLDYYELDYDLYNEILTYIDKNKYFKLLKLMFPNYNFVFDYKNITFDILKKSIKYFFRNNQIYFITNDKNIYNLEYFSLIKKYVKRNIYDNNYIVPFKKYSYEFNEEYFIGVYLDKLEYNEHYILDIIKNILEKKNIICDFIWVSKKYKIMILSYTPMSILKKFLINIYKNNFELKIDYNEIIKKKSLIDIVNFKHYNINLYQQITKEDIIQLCKKIFKHDNIKFIGPKNIK